MPLSPVKQDVHVVVFQTIDQGQDVLHGLAFGNNAVKVVMPLDLPLQALDLRPQVFFLQRPLDEQQQVCTLEWFGQVIKRAQTHRFDGCLDGAKGRDHDDRQGGVVLFGATQDIHTLDAVEDEIGDQEIRTALLQCRQEVGPLLIRFGGVALFREQIDEPGAHLAIIVQDHNVRSPWVPCAPHSVLSFLLVLAEDAHLHRQRVVPPTHARAARTQ